MTAGRERAAYKESARAVKQTGCTAKLPAHAGLFRPDVGSPPGLPGGGMTGMLPVSGVGRVHFRVDAGGGHSTPSDLGELVAERLPRLPGGGAVGRDGAVRRHRRAIGGALRRRRRGRLAAASPWWAAPARSRPPGSAASATHGKEEVRCFILHEGKTRAGARVPRKPHITICGNGSARNGPSAASAAARPA